MKPRERFAGDDPREWLNRAHSNLARSKLRAPNVYLEDLCHDAQQAAEKALKGLLLARGIQFPLTHDLSAILSLVEQAGMDIPPHVFEGAALTLYAVATRYPGPMRPVTEAEYSDAVNVAERVVRWVEEVL